MVLGKLKLNLSLCTALSCNTLFSHAYELRLNILPCKAILLENNMKH